MSTQLSADELLNILGTFQNAKAVPDFLLEKAARMFQQNTMNSWTVKEILEKELYDKSEKKQLDIMAYEYSVLHESFYPFIQELSNRRPQKLNIRELRGRLKENQTPIV